MTTQPIRRYCISVTLTEPRDPDDTAGLSSRERTLLEKKIIRLLAPLDGDVDAEVLDIEDMEERS